MYIKQKWHYTNTPTNITASYNTWPYNVRGENRFQIVPTYFIDHIGNVRKWTEWNPPTTVIIPGSNINATSTRSGSYTTQNIIKGRHVP